MIFCTRSTPMRKFFYYYYYFYYFIVNILWLSNMADNFFRNSRAAQIFVGLFFLDCAFRMLIGWADKLRSHVWYIGQILDKYIGLWTLVSQPVWYKDKSTMWLFCYSLGVNRRRTWQNWRPNSITWSTEETWYLTDSSVYCRLICQRVNCREAGPHWRAGRTGSLAVIER